MKLPETDYESEKKITNNVFNIFIARNIYSDNKTFNLQNNTQFKLLYI